MTNTNKTHYDVLIFDLDGTLSESKQAITKGVKYALNSFNIHVDDINDLEYFIGPPMVDLFIADFGMSREDAVKGVDKYREYFRDQGLKEHTIYDGAYDLINTLANKTERMAIATCKPTVYAEKILANFKLDHHFSPIIGTNLDHTRTTKIEVLDHVLSFLGDYKKDRMVMIGDRQHDLNAAHQLGIDSIGVLYGYGSEKEVKTADPTYLVKDMTELAEFLNA